MTAELPDSNGASRRPGPFTPGLLLAKRPWVRYSLAVALTVAALLLRELFNPVLGNLGPFLSLYVALTIAAIYLGAGPAALTTLLGLLGSTHWVLSQAHFSFESLPDLAYSAGYLLVAGTIIFLAESNRRTLLQVEAARHTLEEKVDERTRELQVALANLKAEIKVRGESEEARRKISARLLHLQDDEHRRIARELHDSMGQTLAALKMSVSWFSNLARNGLAVSKRLEEINELIDEAIRQTRTVSHLLHPPMLDELGFASAASWYVDGFARRSGIEVKLEFPDGLEPFSESIDLTLFRVLQESLTNILRHSESKKAEVRLQLSAPDVILSIRDYGKGIAPDRLEKFMATGADVGVGLGGMRERVQDLGGKLELRNQEVGTMVKVTLPIVGSAANTAAKRAAQNPGLAANA